MPTPQLLPATLRRAPRTAARTLREVPRPLDTRCLRRRTRRPASDQPDRRLDPLGGSTRLRPARPPRLRRRSSHRTAVRADLRTCRATTVVRRSPTVKRRKQTPQALRQLPTRARVRVRATQHRRDSRPARLRRTPCPDHSTPSDRSIRERRSMCERVARLNDAIAPRARPDFTQTFHG